MSQEMLQQIGSFKAGASISAYRVVGPHTTTAKRTVAQWATATSIIIGVSADDYSTDAAAAIVMLGTAKVQCGASVTMFKPVTPQTDTGLIIESTLTADTAASLALPCVLGIALESGSTNSVIEVQLQIRNLRFDF